MFKRLALAASLFAIMGASAFAAEMNPKTGLDHSVMPKVTNLGYVKFEVGTTPLPWLES